MVSRLNKGETRNIGVSWDILGDSMQYSWGSWSCGILFWNIPTSTKPACFMVMDIYISYLYPHIFIRSWLMLDPNDQYCWEYTVCMVIKQFAMEKDHWYIYIVIGCNWMYIIGKLHLKITVPEDMHDCTIIQSRHIHPHTMNIQPRTWSIPARTIDQNQFAGPGRTETTARGKGNVQPCLQRQNFDIIPMMFINGHNM